MYKDELIKLIVKGIVGMVIGIILAFVDPAMASFEFALVLAIFFAGLPYGWQLSGQVLGGWSVSGSLLWVIAGFFIRFTIALVVGWIAYPIALIVTIIKMIKK